MKRSTPWWPLLALALAGQAAAQPQQVYRCGPDGRQWQQYPCGRTPPSGANAFEPSAADRAAAAERVKREAELADRMQQEREQRERDEAARAPLAGGIGPAAKPDAKPARRSVAKGSGRSGDFSAISPPVAHKKR